MDHVDLTTTQLLGAWRAMCAGAPGYQHRSADGLEYVFSGLPIAFFNVAVVTARQVAAPLLDATARSAMHWARAEGAPWLFIVTHEALEPGVDAAATLEPSGLVPLLPLTGMLARQIPHDARVPAGLQLEVPEDDAGCCDVIDVNSAAYGMDLNASKPAFGRGSFWADHVPVLGRAGGAPATSAAVLLSGGHRYVALVATQPGHQKKGFAEAAMRLALHVAAEKFGERPSFLHATDAGRPIYARMGYETLASHTCFIDKRLLEGHTN